MPASTSDNDNAHEIARLRNKKNFTLTIFFGSIAFMVLSCPGFFGLGALIRNETVQMVFYATAIFGPFVGLGGMILMLGDRGRYVRSVDLALEADELGMAFREKPSRRQIGEVSGFLAFQDHTDEHARNSLEGEHKSTTLLIMDYNCSWGTGTSAQVTLQTVFVFPDSLPEAPDLLLYPRGLLDKMAEAVGLRKRPIAIAGEKQMNKEYGLYTDREKKAVALFSPDVVDVCLEERTLVLEINRGTLLVFWSDTYVKPAELHDRLATALRLKKLLAAGERTG
jgi:hypothetical protein